MAGKHALVGLRPVSASGILLESLSGILDPRLLDITDIEYYTILPIFFNITDITNITNIANITNITNIANITHFQYYWGYSILPIYLNITNVTNITNITKIVLLLSYSIIESILLILPSITIFLNITNIIQYYIASIH